MPNLVELKRNQTLAPSRLRLRVLLVALVAAVGLVACGGDDDSSGSNSSGGGDSGGDNAGGGGPNGPDASDNIPTTTSLEEIYELTGDADQKYRLFYVDASRDNGQTGLGHAADPWLMAYNPITDSKETIDKKYSWLGSNTNSVSPLALHEADINISSGEVDNYHIASVTYIQDEPPTPPSMIASPSKLMRVGVAAGSLPKQVTSEVRPSGDLGFISSHQTVSFNLNDANKAEYVFQGGASTTSSRQYRLTPLDADTSTPARDFRAGLNVQTPLFATQGAAGGSAYGWLVVDQTKNDCLAFVSGSDLTSATCIPNANATGNVPLVQDGDNPSSYISGVYPLNSGVVLALPEASSNPLRSNTTIWFYEQGSGGDPGTLHLLKNDNGETLKTTGLPLFGPDEAGRVVSKGGNTLYLAASDGGIGGLLGGGSAPTDPLDIEFDAFLFKITTSAGNIGWEQVYHKGGAIADDEAAYLGDFLVDASDHLIWEINEHLIAISLDGQSEVVLDDRSSDGSNLLHGAFNTPAGAISQGDWFFYNRESNQSDYATAIKVDGSRRVELKDCTWIGASTSGKANYTGGNFASLEPAQVFMACNNKQLAAVDANNPLAGRVILGSLTESAENIEMGHSTPGPHRLMRITYDDERYEVVYVNTREKDSLKYLMDNPASEDAVGNLAGQTAPVNGF